MNEYISIFEMMWILPKYQLDWEIQIQHMCWSDLLNLNNLGLQKDCFIVDARKI